MKMEEEASSPETQGHHPGLVSQVELSFVALNLGEAKISSGSLAKASSGGEQVRRNSLRGAQIKVRVKTFSQSQPHSEPTVEEEEDEGSEHEHEIEPETETETRARSSSSRITSELPPLSPRSNDEEESIGSATPTAPPSTPRRTFEEDTELIKNSEETEDGIELEDEEEQSSSEEVPEGEEELKKENTHSTLIEKECVVPEVLIVWEYVCKFIIQKMLEGFAVRVPGLGTFSHSVLPNDIVKKPDSEKFSLRKTRKFPVFKICPHLKEMYRLVEENHLYQCNVPTIPLNISAIASNARLSPGIVDGIMVETLQSFVTGIITNKCLEFPFPFIGKLYIKQRKVFMIFYRHFCEGLSFEFNYAPSYITSVFPGNMTPLAYHRPATEFHSVFHFCDVRSVEDKITARPRPYAKGKLFRENSVSGDPCEFEKNLFTHSNLLYDCSCCKSKRKSQNEDEKESLKDMPSPPCGYSKNYDRIKKACCTQQGSFAFQKPDGSTFSPEPLYKSSKTGNPILDRLADDRCLLQQAIGCWMKRKVVQTLGAETIAKHHDREYFQRIFQEKARNGGQSRKSYLVREPDATTPITVSPSPSSVQKKSINSVLSNLSMSKQSGEEEETVVDDEEENELIDEKTEEPTTMPNRISINVKAIRSKSFRNSKDVSSEVSQLEEEGQIENPSVQQQRNSTETSFAEFEQNE